MGIKKIRRKVIGGLSDVLSYPKRTLYNTIESINNDRADAIRLKRDKLRAEKEFFNKKHK